MSSKWAVDDWVEKAAQSPISSFYPSLPARSLDMPLADVLDRLATLVADGKIECIVEVKCPGCYATLSKVPYEVGGLPSAFVECDRCGFEGHVDESMVFLLFRITPDYRESVKKNLLSPIQLFLKY